MKPEIKYALRVLLGLMFIISAVAKLISVDQFEIYIFGFRLFGLGLSYFIARAIIAMELALGILLILNLHSKAIFLASFLVLALFSLFLIGLTIAGNRESCHCFGELVDMNPRQSLLKNIILLVILRLSAGLKSFRIPWKPLWYTLVISGSIATVFIISPPDNWRYDQYGRSTIVSEKAFEDAFSHGLLPTELLEGEKVVCFMSITCEYCLMAARKIAILRSNKNFSNGELTIVFAQGNVERDPSVFLENSGLDYERYLFLDATPFIRITEGTMPLTLVLNEGKIIAKYGYRDIR
jgi:thiol-disulfide isomerase/thioredoxin